MLSIKVFLQGNCFSRSYANAEHFASCEDPQELKNFSPMIVALFYTRKDEQEVKSNAGTGAFGQLCVLRTRKSH